MKYVPFEGDRLQLSRICLGTMTFGDRCDERQSTLLVKEALEHGINFFDTAAMYASGTAEEFLGHALGASRRSVFIATKVHAGLDRVSIVSSIDGSLRRLGTDYVDLYLIHWPARGMELEEMMLALSEVVHAGKARFVGCCNFPAWLLAESNAVAERNGFPRLVSHQVAYNLFERGVEIEVLPQAACEGIFVTAYRPLAMGLLSGAFRQGKALPAGLRGSVDPRVITWLSQHGDAIERFVAYAEQRGIVPAALALAWILSCPAIACPIVGVSSTEQVRDAVSSVDIALGEKEAATISEMFHTEVWEEGLQLFPGLKYNYPRIRRALFLTSQRRLTGTSVTRIKG